MDEAIDTPDNRSGEDEGDHEDHGKRPAGVEGEFAERVALAPVALRLPQDKQDEQRPTDRERDSERDGRDNKKQSSPVVPSHGSNYA